MNIPELKTTQAKAWLNKSDDELMSIINCQLNNTTMKDDLKADVITLHAFIVNSGRAQADATKTKIGLGRLIESNTASMVIDLSGCVRNISICDDFETLVALRFLQTKLNAKERGLEFGLSLLDIRHLLQTKYCRYSGIEMLSDSNSRLTFDRINNNKGYVKGNVVACSNIANRLKNNMTEQVTHVLGAQSIRKMLVSFADIQTKKMEQTA